MPSPVAAVVAETTPPDFWLARAENALSIAVLVALTAIPLVDLAGRELFGASLPGGSTAVQYLTLWITFLGAALAARSDRLLALATVPLLSPSVQSVVKIAVGFVAVAIVGAFTLASVELIDVDRRYGSTAVWGIPVWCVSLVMPVTLAAIVARTIAGVSAHAASRVLAALVLVAVALASLDRRAGRHRPWRTLRFLLRSDSPGEPVWMRRVGAEWIYRLIQEPGRLWRRYLVGNVAFLPRVLDARLAR